MMAYQIADSSASDRSKISSSLCAYLTLVHNIIFLKIQLTKKRLVVVMFSGDEFLLMVGSFL